MLTKTNAIVLRCLRYADQKYIVDFYTEAYGRVACAVKISATQRGKLRKQLFQPLTMLLLELDHRPRQQMQRLVDAQLAAPWTSLTTDITKMTVAMFIAEVMYHAIRQEQEDRQLYRFVEASLQWLDAADSGVANFHIAFMIRLTQYLGCMPSADDYHDGALFDMRTGEFTLVHPAYAEVLSAEESRRMLVMLRMTYPTMHLYRMSHHERQRCLDIIIAYYRLHIPAFPVPKSLAVLEEVFG